MQNMETLVKGLFEATAATDAAMEKLQRQAGEIRRRYDETAKAVQEVVEDVLDTAKMVDEIVANAEILTTAETIILNSVWCVTYAVAFTFYLGQACGKAYREHLKTKIRQSIVATPDPELNEVAELSILELGATVEDLQQLPSNELRKLCSRNGVKWRNAHGSHHLSKAEMVAALAA